MKIHGMRLFLLFFTGYMLTGFESAGFKGAFAAEQQTVQVPVGQVIRKEVGLNSKQKTVRNKSSVLRVETVPESPRALILSIPFEQPGNILLRNTQNLTETETINIFATESKSKQQPLDLDGQMLMSQEPEMDKRKSVDGAGIVINLKR